MQSLTSISLFVLLLNTPQAVAKVYHWIDEDGVSHYTTTPPPEQDSREYNGSGKGTSTYPSPSSTQSKQQPTATERHQSKPTTQPSGLTVSLTGRWCEYATSNSANGKKDYSNPGFWEFTNKGMVSFTEVNSGKVTEAKYSQKNGELTTEHKHLGSYQLIEKKGLQLILTKKNSYHFWRRGSCF